MKFKAGDRIFIRSFEDMISTNTGKWRADWEFWGRRGKIIDDGKKISDISYEYSILLEDGSIKRQVLDSTIKLDLEYYRDIKLSELGI